MCNTTYADWMRELVEYVQAIETIFGNSEKLENIQQNICNIHNHVVLLAGSGPGGFPDSPCDEFNSILA